MRKWTTEDKEKAASLLRKGATHKEVGTELGRSANAVRVWAQNNGILVSRIRGSKSTPINCGNCGTEFMDLPANNRRYCSQSCAATINNSKYPKRVKKIILKECNQCGTTYEALPVSKFCSRTCSALHRTFSSVRKGNPSASTLRNYLLHTRPLRCDVCRRKKWQGVDIPLEADHINGDPYDHRDENLRLICSNCHALTDTYKGKNRGKGRHYRRQRYAEGKSY